MPVEDKLGNWKPTRQQKARVNVVRRSLGPAAASLTDARHAADGSRRAGIGVKFVRAMRSISARAARPSAIRASEMFSIGKGLSV